MENKESKIMLKWMTNFVSEIEFSLRPGLVRQNCSCGSVWSGSRSVNMQFYIKLATSVAAGRD